MITADYLCDTCAEIFEVRWRNRDEKKRTIAVKCPICGSGHTSKLIAAPAISVWWKDAQSAVDAGHLRPSFRPGVSARRRRGGRHAND